MKYGPGMMTLQQQNRQMHLPARPLTQENRYLYLPFGANSPPVANSQLITTNKNKPIAITLTATDANNDLLTYSVVTQPANGTLTGTAPALTYNPDQDYVGPDSFNFKANDGSADSNIAIISITVKEPGQGGGGGGDTTMHQVLPPQVLTTLMWQALLLCSSHHLVLQPGLRHQQTLQVRHL